MLFLIEARVSAKVAGISAPFEKDVSYLVNGNNYAEAKTKFENQVKMDHAHMMPDGVTFQYTKVASEIK